MVLFKKIVDFIAMIFIIPVVFVVLALMAFVWIFWKGLKSLVKIIFDYLFCLEEWLREKSPYHRKYSKMIDYILMIWE